MGRPGAELELYWIPVGAGGHVVRRCAAAYERWTAARERRPPAALVHAALIARLPGADDIVIEVAPEADARGGVSAVAGGAVGWRPLGRSRWFRYEVRRWAGGEIPDLGDALAGPIVVGTGEREVAAVLSVLAEVPTPVWGRDELGAGEMWNSNSVVAWALERCGLLADAVGPPPGARAPGWTAGRAVARRAGPAAAEQGRSTPEPGPEDRWI